MTALSLYSIGYGVRRTGRSASKTGTTQFTLSGVKTPCVYTLSSLRALPAVQLTATYTARREPGHGHVHRRLRVDAAQSGGTDHRPEHQEFARIVVPGDAAGGRYISNLVAFEVFTAAPVPEPATWVLLIAPLPLLAFLASRRRTFASGQAPVRRRYVARE